MENAGQIHHCCPDFAFGFDDPAFSDRILKLVISDDLLEANDEDNAAECHKLIDQTMSLKQRKHKIPKSQKNKLNTYCTAGTRVKIVKVNSLLLAAKSLFFRKLFSNGMKASNQHEVALRIHSYEEVAVMDIIRFMYKNSLQSANSPDALVQMLVTADKFDVPSCVDYCCKLLTSFSMTDKLALFFIDIPSSLASIEAIQPLVKAAIDFLPNILKLVPKYRSYIINMSLDGIKIVLSSDDLKMDSEDAVFDLFVEWAEKQYPDEDDRKNVYNTELLNLIRLDQMSREKLSIACELITSHNQDLLDALVLDEKNVSAPKSHRLYNLLPVSTITIQTPAIECLIFMDVKRDECKDVTCLNSQTFNVAGHTFYLQIQRCNERSKDTFGLFIIMKTSRNQSKVYSRYEFAVRKMGYSDFCILEKDNYCSLKVGVRNGRHDLFNRTWDEVIAENSELFRNGIMHFRVQLILSYS